jgi:hypothetical protein
LSTAEIALTVITTVLGIVAGVVTSHYYFRREVDSEPRLVVGLTETARLNPASVGVKVEMKVGSITVGNLVVLRLTVTNRGRTDVVVPDAEDEGQHRRRPRIELPDGLRSLTDPWNPNGPSTLTDVRVARRLREEDNRQVLYLHVHGLAAGETSSTTVLCTDRLPVDRGPLSGEALRFFPGITPRFTVRADGLLRAAARLKE